MENPEEILHSLEEFAKMKPKDIPRELEEYLKFVAKTGDPVYQWSAIKSLFREKLINVITEFYESCSSMEIPPCPNVEMFNYDLMKNFILEKLDTFASAPFTLQRICELLTSPRKEYTRIDKYMRALEKNILVVSTMEPGGRRTENGDGVMNGIESDHEHVPEPANEINVEEMDDSPSWPQTIQTNNHISEPIFDNPEHEFHVSSTNQEMVCVQYVSVEPLASEGLPIQVEEVKESDISVTITALNVKKDDENQGETLIPRTEIEPAMDIPKETTSETTEMTNEILKTEVEGKMDLESIEPIEKAIKDTSKYIGDGVPPATLTEDILPTTTSEKSSQESDVPPILLESESGEIENVSPETSVTSSENSPSQSNTSTEAPSNDINLEDTSNSVDVSEATEENKDKKEILEIDNPGDVDSTTKIAEDDEIIIAEDIKVSTSTDSEAGISEAIPEVDSNTKESEDTKIDNLPVCDDKFEIETTNQPDKLPIVEISSEVLAQLPKEVMKTDEMPDKLPIVEISSEVLAQLPKEVMKTDEMPDLKSDVPAEIKSSEITLIPEEKETPMEVDPVPEDSLDTNDKDKLTVEVPDTSEPPV